MATAHHVLHFTMERGDKFPDIKLQYQVKKSAPAPPDSSAGTMKPARWRGLGTALQTRRHRPESKTGRRPERFLPTGTRTSGSRQWAREGDEKRCLLKGLRVLFTKVRRARSALLAGGLKVSLCRGKARHRQGIASAPRGPARARTSTKAINNRIDTDLERLFVIDPSPLGEPSLDRALERIVSEGMERTIEYWIRELSDDHPALEGSLVERLISRDILFRRQYDRLCVMGAGYSVTEDGQPLADVRRRIVRELSDETIPDPRDMMIFSLADACELWHVLIDKADLTRLAPRIRQIAGMDLIGQVVVQAIQEQMG